MEIEWRSISIDSEGVWRVLALSDDAVVTWKDVLDAWIRQPESTRAWSRLLADLPPVAYRWETPALTTESLADRFECVVIEDPSIAQRPDPGPFSEHLECVDGRTVARFANLGGDATLIAPCPIGPISAYGHLADFLREAPSAQNRTLWREVATAMHQRIGQRPVWLNTHGAGVAWLHVRLDDRPKYYTHAPYREIRS